MQATQMRYLDSGEIELFETDLPDPAAGEIQVVGGACGICSWDVATAKLGSRMYPMAPPGHEGVGYVAKVGPGVHGYREGDRVTGGGFATVRNVPVARAYPIPESDLDDSLWIVEPVSCVVTGLDQSQLRPGDRVALIGCGFMGLLLLQGLLQHPLDQVVAVDISERRLKVAQELGAPEVHNVAQEDRDELAANLKARDIDVVIDASGSQPGLDLATDIIKRGGRINLFGWLKGETATFDPTKWHLGGFTIVNSAPSAKMRDPFPPAIRLIHQGVFDLRPLVTHVVPLPEYPALMQKVLQGDETYIKGVITL